MSNENDAAYDAAYDAYVAASRDWMATYAAYVAAHDAYEAARLAYAAEARRIHDATCNALQAGS